MLFYNEPKTLADAKLNETVTVRDLTAEGDVRRRFLDLGIVCGAAVKPLFKSPFGDPVAYEIHSTVIALRLCDCKTILIEKMNK